MFWNKTNLRLFFKYEKKLVLEKILVCNCNIEAKLSPNHVFCPQDFCTDWFY